MLIILARFPAYELALLAVRGKPALEDELSLLGIPSLWLLSALDRPVHLVPVFLRGGSTSNVSISSDFVLESEAVSSLVEIVSVCDRESFPP